MTLTSEKKLLIVFAGFIFILSGCASGIYPGGPTPAGGLITNVKSPTRSLTVVTDSSATAQKTGTASIGAFLGLFAFGDASIDAAMKDGGITKVHHVDHEVTSFLFGIWLQDKTIVYGE